MILSLSPFQVDNGKEMEGVNALLDLASVATSVMSNINKDTSQTESMNTSTDAAATKSQSPSSGMRTRSKKKLSSETAVQ